MNYLWEVFQHAKQLLHLHGLDLWQDTNFQTFDVDISKLADTTDVKVIFTFDCEQGAEEIRDMKPDYFDIKGEVFVNFYKDKRTIIEVSPSSDSNCNPDFRVFYE